MALWTTDECLSRAKRIAQWPDSGKLTDAQCLEIMSEELWTFVAPLVRSVSEAYWVKRYTVALTSGLATYTIPARATSGSVFDLSIVDTQGNYRRLNKIQAADVFAYYVQPNVWGIPTSYYIEADTVHLVPSPGPNLSLMIRYERRPSSLVLTTSCAAISAVGGGTLTSTTSLGNGTFDIQQTAPNFDALYDDVAMTLSGTYVYTPTTPTTFTGVSVGDYICPAGYTCIVPIPDVMFPVLAYRTAAEMLTEAGDVGGAGAILAGLQTRMPGIMETLEPRAETSAPAIFNRWSSLRGG